MRELIVNKKTLLVIVIGLVLVLLLGVPSRHFDENQHTEALFVYGTLKNSWVRLYACGCRPSKKPFILQDYKKEGLNISPEPGKDVTGMLIFITKDELLKIDSYENTPDNYKREQITLNDETFWVYTKN